VQNPTHIETYFFRTTNLSHTRVQEKAETAMRGRDRERVCQKRFEFEEVSHCAMMERKRFRLKTALNGILDGVYRLHNTDALRRYRARE
jgi:hypothetical protein